MPRSIMTVRDIATQEDASIKEAAAQLVDESVSCLPVLDGAGAVSGVVTSKDILRHAATS